MAGAAHRALLATHRWLHARPPLFPVLKVALFGLLAVTSALYIRDDILAAQQTLDAEAGWMDRLSWFAISIDYVAWYTLLLLYELQTSLLDDDLLKGRLRWLMNGLAGLCYLAVFYALAGYLGKLWMVVQFDPVAAADLCAGLGDEARVWMQALDAFVPVSAGNCETLNAAMARGELFQLRQEPILFRAEDYRGLGGAWSLAWADAVEAVLWIAALGLIQLEIVLQLRGELGEALLARLQSVKGVIYAAIIAVTAYYSLFGRTLDLYDSILWLLAFLFIEINITEWNEDDPAPGALPRTWRS